MQNSWKNKYSFIVAIGMVLVMLVCKYRSFNERTGENPYPIAYDVYGYYLYLPATFIYHDPGLENRTWLQHITEKYKPAPAPYQYTKGKGDRQVIIYNIGYSFIYAPGFFVANALASSLGFEPDGFSKPYQYSLELTAFLFTLIGLFMFRKIALRFFSDKITAALLLTVLVGSNYFFQVTYDGVMPHNFLFTLNCFIIWYTIKWHEEKKLVHLLFLSLFLGLATICRPTELIWILLPMFWNVYDKRSFAEKMRLFLIHRIQIIIACAVLFLIICIQLFYLKYATGFFRALNLHSERFAFFDPYTFKFLFSYRKGWLLYTPIMIFGIVGFYFLRKQNKTIWLPLTLFFAVNLYVVSSWECWWYAASYGQRPMVETYSMMLFPMGYLLNRIYDGNKKWIVYSLSIFLGLLILLNLFQTWQFVTGIIDPERMTEKYYKAVFGKTNPDPNFRHYLRVDRNQDVFNEYAHFTDSYLKVDSFKLDFEKPVSGIDQKNTTDTSAGNGKRSFILSGDVIYSPSYEKKYYDLTRKNYLWVRVSVLIKIPASPPQNNSAIVVAVESKGETIKYSTLEIGKLHLLPDRWTPLHLDVLTPDIRHKDDVIKAYYWNMEKMPILIDDFTVEVFEPKIDYD